MMRPKHVLVGCAVMPILGAACLFEMSIWPQPFSDGNGSPTYAKKWKARLEELPDPETARAKYKDIVVKRYGDEWIFGVAADSHSSIYGGTFVVKDSRGNVRASFGQVCGGSPALEIGFESATSLDDFYQSEWMQQFGFTEYQVP